VVQADPRTLLLLYLHGARWDVPGSSPLMRRKHELGCAVPGIDFRGVGQLCVPHGRRW
jgi:hypothetical protein